MLHFDTKTLLKLFEIFIKNCIMALFYTRNYLFNNLSNIFMFIIVCIKIYINIQLFDKKGVYNSNCYKILNLMVSIY